MINIIFIIIIIILIIIYIRNKKKEHFIVDSTIDESVKEYVINNKLNLSSMRTLIEFLKYLYPDQANLTLPTDTIINSNINTNTIIVENNCIINDSIEIDNLTVDGNIYMNNKNNTYKIDEKSNNKNMILDILPIGTVIPWTLNLNLPIGWVLCNGDTWTSDDGYTSIVTPPINKNNISQNANTQIIDGRIIIGCDTTGVINQTGGADRVLLFNTCIPKHNHDLILNFSSSEQCEVDNTNNTSCKYSGYHFGRQNKNEYTTGNTNSILSFDGMAKYVDNPYLDNTFSARCVSYIIKVF